MRSNEVFARMTPERATQFLGMLREDARPVAQMALAAAATAFKLRPQFIKKQPRPRQAEWMRKALARTSMAAAAEEILAEYFLGHQNELLSEWLDALGVEHEDGVLEETPDCPERKKLENCVETFRGGEGSERRELLLHAFAAQSAIDWPVLEEILGVAES